LPAVELVFVELIFVELILAGLSFGHLSFEDLSCGGLRRALGRLRASAFRWPLSAVARGDQPPGGGVRGWRVQPGVTLP